MKQHIFHPWDVSVDKAKNIQQQLKNKINLCDIYSSLEEIHTVAGCDVHFKDFTVVASIVIMEFPSLKTVDKKILQKTLNTIPAYIPSYLAFREGRIITELFSTLQTIPDVTIFDAQGIAHPVGIGLATHIGILFDIVTIGCAKNILYGVYKEPLQTKGSFSYIKDINGQNIGVCLRTKENVKPVFVSPGNKISIDFAYKVILACCTKYRLPQPLRIAHQLAKNKF